MYVGMYVGGLVCIIVPRVHYTTYIHVYIYDVYYKFRSNQCFVQSDFIRIDDFVRCSVNSTIYKSVVNVLICIITAYEICSHEITSYDITSYEITSYEITSHEITSYDITSISLQHNRYATVFNYLNILITYLAL